MFKKTESFEDVSPNEQVEVREKVKAMVQKLQDLKSRISELRAHFEEIQRSRVRGGSGAFLCDECGRAITLGQEVEAKNFSQRTHHYHRECFRKIWVQ